MEGVKGFIYDRGELPLPNGKPGKAYLVGFLLVTDQPLPNVESETFVMKTNRSHNWMTEAVAGCDKYRPPRKMGDIAIALMEMKDFEMEDLEPLGPEKKQ